MNRPIHVVGGGIAGLVASITAAEAGAPVVLHEASDRIGGRALGRPDRPGVNLGPRVVFTDGALVRWLRERTIPVPLRPATGRGIRLLDDRGPHVPLLEALRLAPALLPRSAPVDEPFAGWAARVFGDDRATLLARLAGLPTYHHDPGALSAAYVWERWRRTFLAPHHVRWVVGGWSTLVDALAARAAELGVVLAVGERLGAGDLPDAPTVVATPLPTAARLLERPLEWPGTRTALLDVGLDHDPRWPNLVADVRADLDTCCMVERQPARGVALYQAQLGVPAGTGAAAGAERIERTLDAALPGWRDRTRWRDARLVVDATGAVDPPGTSWRDRPAIDQGDDRYLAGDAVAAPGMLSEVAVNSAVHAARLAVAARRRRSFAAGWPSVELTPERRLAVLAAATDGATHNTTTATWRVEPVDQTGPGYRLARRFGFTVATAEQGSTVVVPPPRLPFGRPLAAALARLVAGRR